MIVIDLSVLSNFDGKSKVSLTIAELHNLEYFEQQHLILRNHCKEKYNYYEIEDWVLLV